MNDEIYTYLIKEYLSKCNACDECFAEFYCITNNLRNSRIPQHDCEEKIKEYLKYKKI